METGATPVLRAKPPARDVFQARQRTKGVKRFDPIRFLSCATVRNSPCPASTLASRFWRIVLCHAGDANFSETPAGNCARSNPNSYVQNFVAYATKVRHGRGRERSATLRVAAPSQARKALDNFNASIRADVLRVTDPRSGQSQNGQAATALRLGRLVGR